MLQQINLYPLLPIEARFKLTWKIALSIYSILILLLMFVYGVELRKKQQIMKEYTELNNQVNVLNATLASLMKKYPIHDAMALDNHIQQLKHELLSKTNLSDLLDNKKHFSSYLTALSNIDLEGVWLTEIRLSNVGKKIDLKGFALHSDLVNEMVTRLSAQPVFSTLEFEVQTINELPPPPSFELSAEREIVL